MYLPQNQLIPAVASVEGDILKFAQYAPVWRCTLELIRELALGSNKAQDAPLQLTEDHIVGRYAILDLPKWGG
jgi:hypothetical protein